MNLRLRYTYVQNVDIDGESDLKKIINFNTCYILQMNKNKLYVKDVDISLNLHIFFVMLVLSGICIIFSGVLSQLVNASLPAVISSWVLGITIAVISNYMILSKYKMIKDIKIELSEEEEGEKIYTVMKIE